MKTNVTDYFFSVFILSLYRFCNDSSGMTSISTI